MTDNPLIADNRQSGPFVNLTGLDATEGTGPLSGFASIVKNMERGDWDGALIDAGGVVLDGLGYVENPLRSLAGAGLGWLIEHVSIFNEILSTMAGDPNQVADHAQTWNNIGDHVTSRVQALQASVSKLSAEADAEAVLAYRIAVNDFARAVVLSGDAAYRAADGTNTAGTVVATTRSLIRDSFAEWAVDRVWKWAATSPLVAATFGGAQAAFLADSLVSGARVAGRATKELRTLARTLDDLAATAKAGSRSLTDAAAALRKTAAPTSASSAVGAVARRVRGNTPPLPKTGDLVDRAQDLGVAARKQVDEVNEAVQSAAASAAKRAEAGKKIGGRRGPDRAVENKAGHAAAKRHQKSADASVANQTGKLSGITDDAHRLAADAGRLNQRAADNVALANARDKALEHAKQVAKETTVQSSNEDIRAENAQQGYLDANAEKYDGEQKTTARAEPGEVEVDENLLPGEPPAFQPLKKETWQVRGTLGP